MKPLDVTEAQIAEWRRVIAEHTPISASDLCPTCGSQCEPTWRTQRRWALEMLSLYAAGQYDPSAGGEKGGAQGLLGAAAEDDAGRP